MGRIHAFEFEDLAWFPQWLRTPMTEYLEHVMRLAPALHAYVAGRLAPALRESGARRIVDLGSGSGGILPAVLEALERDEGLRVQAVLTDKYPDPDTFRRLGEAAGERLDFVATPVDATDVPADLEGMRTLFLSLHHFRPEQARAVLADAARDGRAIGVFEATGRSALALVSVPAIPLLVLLLTPFIRPFRWSRLLLTYVVPVLPLLILWDGLVSNLRTYSTRELEALVEGIDAPGYRWDVRREWVKGAPAPVTSLVGVPAASARASGAAPAQASGSAPSTSAA